MAKYNQYEVEALVYIKYDDSPFKIGDKFVVKAEELNELVSKGYVEKIKGIKQKEDKIDEPMDEEPDEPDNDG